MSHARFRQSIVHGFSMSLILAFALGAGRSAPADEPDLMKLVGQPADIAPSAIPSIGPSESWRQIRRKAGSA